MKRNISKNIYFELFFQHQVTIHDHVFKILFKIIFIPFLKIKIELNSIELKKFNSIQVVSNVIEYFHP
jgi:hypothetical protein